MSRDTGRIVALSLLSVFLWVVSTNERMQPSQSLGASVITYECYTCDEAKTDCTLIPMRDTLGLGSPCKAAGLSTSCAAACECPSGTWPCDENACLAAFTDVKNWSSYKPNATEGYAGSIYVAPYLLFVPGQGKNGPHGVIWYYNTQALLDAPSSWTVADPSSMGLGTVARGYAGGTTDGTRAYLAPNKNNLGPSGYVMSVDMTKDVKLVSSYELFSPSDVVSAGGAVLNGDLLDSTASAFKAAKGFNGAVFDGSYVYFVPDVNYEGAHNNVMRYDVSKPFKDLASWEVYNPKSVNSTKKGYAGAIFDGRYVYFIPKGDQKNQAFMHGEVMRYDTRAAFNAPAAWTTFDPSSNGFGAGARGYNGGVSDGKYLYLAPYINANGPHGNVLRYDLSQPFDNISSWTVFDVADKVDSTAKGYIGAAFDGQFVYFSPYSTEENTNANVLRYNTKGAFDDAESWTVFEAGLAETQAAGIPSTGSNASKVPTAAGISFIATAADGTKDANGVLNLSAPSKVTFDWECPGSNFTDAESGLEPTPVVCTFTKGDGMTSTVKQYGADSVLDVNVTRTGTYGIDCSFDRYNDETRVKVNLCSKRIVVNVAGTTPESPSAQPSAGGGGTIKTAVEGDVLNLDGSTITVKQNARISFHAECLTVPRSDPANGLVASNLVCDYKLNGATLPGGEVTYQGPRDFAVSAATGTYSFSCRYTVSNVSGISNTYNVCDQSANVATN